ncbi:MAG TPA: M23 family metallopeptidase [Bacilli bacterium]|jgi:murein DD-endopeptidase MepM/ murein hydrolase activator NlpD|nr:M23 family metallopeptidase [Bacilli bacterium]
MFHIYNNLKVLFQEHHVSMMLLVLTFFLFICAFPSNVKAASFEYSEFDWDSFAEENKTYWDGYCKDVADDQKATCQSEVLKAQKHFYKKLYKILTKYEEKGLFIYDDVIIETVFFELTPSQAGSGSSEYDNSFSTDDGTALDDAYKFDPDEAEDSDPDIDVSYDDKDQAEKWASYYEKEKDTLKTLISNCIAYYTYCYGIYGSPKTNTASDGSTYLTCPDSGNVTKIYQPALFGTETKTYCATNISEDTNSNTGVQANELGFWKYFTSRWIHGTTFPDLFKAFLGVVVEDNYYDDCKASNDSYPGGTVYSYINQDGEDEAHVSYDRYFDFLKNSRYFDGKAHLQSHFKQDVLEPAGVDCLSSDICSNSLEAAGLYDDYAKQLEDDRLEIIYDIIDVLNDYGLDISYNGYGSEAFDDRDAEEAERNSFYWPIGSDEITNRDGIDYADGTPAKTTKDIIHYFGEYTDPNTGEVINNHGIDIAGDEGKTNVIAAYTGTVIYVVNNCTKGDKTCNEGLGNEIILQHDNGDYTVYAHLGSIDSAVVLSAKIQKGQLMGKVGMTGNVSQAELYYELRIGGNDVSCAVNPLDYTKAGRSVGDDGDGDDDYRPVGPSTGYGAISTRFSGMSLTKEEFVTKVKKYCSTHGGKIAGEICSNPDVVYDTSKSADVNPTLVVVRAIVEGNSPGSGHNYWGIGCTNGGGVAACYSFSSLADGVRGFANVAKKYNTLADMMKKYAYIGKYWFNPGSWGDGGCKYFPYIKKYLSSSRITTVNSACASGKSCSGSSCVPTTAEDQNAYANWQVADKMGPSLYNVFGI